MDRAAVLERLRAGIEAIERRAPAFEACEHDRRTSARWTLGAPQIDRLLGENGLDPSGLHEIKPALPDPALSDPALSVPALSVPALPDKGTSWVAGMSAALAFTLMLAQRRMRLVAQRCGGEAGVPPILWCWPSAVADEIGRPYGPGLQGLGLDPAALLIVETARISDTLWAIEEGLKSRCLALVVGVAGSIDLTPSRRLALAAGAGATPALLLTAARSPATGATATRWRVGRAPGADHALDPKAPAEARLAICLERCRNRPPSDMATSVVLEWSDAAHRFRVASAAGDRADAALRSRRHAG